MITENEKRKERDYLKTVLYILEKNLKKHKVNFDEAMKRQQIYKTAEGRAFLKAKEGNTHHGGCGNCGGEN